MKPIILFLLLLLLSACADQGLPPDPVIRTWVEPDYELCDAHVVNAPPISLFFTIGRHDLLRYDAASSLRPVLVRKDGSYLEVGSAQVAAPKHTVVQPYSWSPDGTKMTFTATYEDAQWAMREEALGIIAIQTPQYKSDSYIYDLISNTTTNITGVNSVSFFNPGAIFISNTELLFGALVDGLVRPYLTASDGSNKRPLTAASGFLYGAVVSPDGAKYAYHNSSQGYKVYVGDVATGVETYVSTPCAFNFMPIWGKDSQHIAFSCGASNNAPDLWIADRNGQNAQFIASRNGFSGSVSFTDREDFHGGASDGVDWVGGQAVIFAAGAEGGKVELFKYDLSTNAITRLTYSSSGAWNNNPNVSNDSNHLVYVSRQPGKAKNVMTLELSTLLVTQITDMIVACSAQYPRFNRGGL